jgi:acetolactate synthase I/III small subunit
VSPPAGGHIPGAHPGGAVPRHHIVTAMVENKAGVLARVASLFSRRGFNIFSLAVAPSDDERFSRITIVVDVESAPLEQIMKQLDKLVNVVTITELAPEEAVEREMLLVTVGAGASAAERADLEALVGEFGASIVDDGPDGPGQERGGRVTVMLAGTPSRIDDFEDMVRPFGITELQRTGLVALPKLSPGHTAPLHSVSGALQGEAG